MFQLIRRHGEAFDEHHQVWEVHEPYGPGKEGGEEERAEEEPEAAADGPCGRPQGQEPAGADRRA